MGIFVVMAHYDPRGVVAPHVRRTVESLAELSQRMVVVSTADLDAADEKWLRERVTLLRRENYGYDFFSYRAGLLADGGLDALGDFDNVIVCNDSFVGPVSGFYKVFEKISSSCFDVWGFTLSTSIRAHVQSYFVSFSSWVVRSQAFRQFWLQMTPLSDRSQVILRYELGLTKALDDAGFTTGSYFVENDADIRLAHRRLKWVTLLSTQGTPLTTRLRRLRAPVKEQWNPAAMMADRVLDDARLPIVKIDTLRYDPYGLNSERLLARCEASYPADFADVRAYLEQTAPFYPGRPNNRLPTPRLTSRPFGPLVHYAGGR